MSEVNNPVGKNGALIEILSSPDKKIHESRNFLTLLTRKIFFDMGLTSRQFFARIEAWLQKKYALTPENIVQISSDRNNFVKEASHDAMTANVFQKVTQSLGASRVTLTVKLEFDDGRPDHTSTVSFLNTTAPQQEGEAPSPKKRKK